MVNIKQEIINVRGLPNDFFEPTITHTHDSSELHNINSGRDLLLKYAYDQSAKITIVADTDIDGIMSSSIMYQWLKNIHPKVKISHSQRNQGHGVRCDRIKPTDLLIIIDSSSNEIDEVKKILQLNKAKDVLIIDHHETDNVMVQNEYEAEINTIKSVILINPQQPRDKYPNKELSGALLTYKFLEYCEKDIDYKYADQLLDLAAISIVSDVMDVSSMENRYYFYEGMSLIKNIGLASLMDKLRVYCKNVSSTDLGFKVNKSLNSVLRLQNILLIFKLILEYQGEEHDYIVNEIVESVSTRDNIEHEIISKISILHDSTGVILAQNNYDGIKSIADNFNGVIASKIADKEGKNVALVNSELKGSCRAYSNYNFKDYINESNFATGAGHQGAFGIKILDLEKLKQFFIDHPPTIEIEDDFEIELNFKDLTKPLFKQVKELQYLIGKGFGKIRFKITHVEIEEIKKTTSGKTYYVSVKPKKYIRIINEVPFDLKVQPGNICDVYCTIDLNNYFGKDYYECNCYNIEITDGTVNDDWGFLDE